MRNVINHLQHEIASAYKDGDEEYGDAVNLYVKQAEALLVVVEAAKNYYRNPGNLLIGAKLHDALAALEENK